MDFFEFIVLDDRDFLRFSVVNNVSINSFFRVLSRVLGRRSTEIREKCSSDGSVVGKTETRHEGFTPDIETVGGSAIPSVVRWLA